MQKKMTTRERMLRMFEHRDADRVPIYDFPWDTTIERWHAEGMSRDTSFEDFFDIDHVYLLQVDNSPQYEKRIVEQTGDYVVSTTEWGVTMKKWRHMSSTPQFLDFTITGPDSWRKARERMVPSRDRIPWEFLEKNYRKMRERGDWIEALVWFGFDVTHAWAVGTERFLMALIDDPEWCRDMFSHYLEVNLALLEMVWDKGYRFDSITWYDDLGYKGSQFMSVEMYRELLKPYHKRVVDWAKAKGLTTRLHSCGDVRPFLPEFIEIGIEALNPLEVKAGMDPLEIKKQYGKDLVLHGGINAVLWTNLEAIEEEIKRIVPALKENGGYIFATDHSVPDTVSLEAFRSVVELAKKVGAY